MYNSRERLNQVFFYGLYMDPEILRAKGVEPRNPRKAIAPGYRLRVGNLATLLRDESSRAAGIVYDLTHDEVSTLYWGGGLDTYVSEALTVETEAGDSLAVLCCNLLVPPANDESNPEYLEKLIRRMGELGLEAPSA
ncbi:gamma-glutamylcyclotransferase family protein [Marinobacter sp. F4216]|uniref:gamma-glutamylcyclotransferase family protein n=1 Tax=Marinobacter sp. F4216 TaxID=2874281 RepID=UPI001CBC8D7E|nr:gamma-glutamylcyclotransferase family protein [Marinobacter sp. F4216]MBZ2167424.1 gamma-glutamylcyclotransferase [Marinobacter sp. F4216]